MLNKKSIIATIIVALIMIICQVSVKASFEIEEIFNANFWEWHTRTTTNDRAYNGNHIKIEPQVITFFGYDMVSYKDFLYRKFEDENKKTFTIRVNEKEANYHTLEGAGFIVNSSIKNNKISGYVILYTQKQLCTYRLDNVDVQQLKTTPNKKISDYGTLINAVDKVQSDIHDVVLEVTPRNITITDNNNVTTIKLDHTKHPGNDFGLISSYVQHDCERLSKIKFERLSIKIAKDIPIASTVDEEGNKIAKAKYKVFDSTGKIVYSGTTDGNGIYTATNVVQGEYIIKQVIPPSGYEKNDEEKKFTIDRNGNIINESGEKVETIEFVNKKKEMQDSSNENNSNNQDNNANNNNNNNSNNSNTDNNNSSNNNTNNSNNSNNNNANNSNNNSNLNNNSNDNTKTPNKVDKTSNNKDTATGKLPQTGENSHTMLVLAIISTFIGIAIISYKKYITA